MNWLKENWPGALFAALPLIVLLILDWSGIINVDSWWYDGQPPTLVEWIPAIIFATGFAFAVHWKKTGWIVYQLILHAVIIFGLFGVSPSESEQFVIQEGAVQVDHCINGEELHDYGIILTFNGILAVYVEDTIFDAGIGEIEIQGCPAHVMGRGEDWVLLGLGNQK